jgi:ABC-type iron transport system FetAB permease component
MHYVTGMLLPAAILALGWAGDRWNTRPAAKARWAALSLREKIARTVRARQLSAGIQAALVALWFALRAAGILSTPGLITGAIVSGFYLAADLYTLRQALAARRAYDGLGPMAYLAEVQHAFPTGQNEETS